MPSLLDQINQARRPAVQVYSPGRLVPGTAARSRPIPQNTRELFAQIAAESKRQTPFPMGSAQHQQAAAAQSPWAGLAESVRSSEAYKPNVQAAQQQAEDDLPWWKQGLGMVFGNPVVSTLMKPLEVLQYPQRAVVLGIEELGKALDLPPAKPGDTRSNWQKVVGDQPYGMGQFFDTGNLNVDRALGFIGDVATDPFTYASGGATRVADTALEATSKAEQLANALSKSDNFYATINAAAAKGDVSNLSRNIERGWRLDSESNQLKKELEAMQRKLAEGPGRVKIEHGRNARAQLIGKLSEVAPQLVEQYGSDLMRAGERGFGAASPELREALGIKSAYRFAGKDIPFSEPLARLTQKGTGAVRAALNEIPGRNIMSRGPKNAEAAYALFIHGAENGLDPLEAATQLGMKDAMKAGREVQGRSYQLLRNLSKDLRGTYDEDGIRNLLRQAETDPTSMNKINKLFADVSAVYEKTTGQKIPAQFKLDPNTYVPHMLTREAKRFLKDNADNSAVKQFRRKAGFAKDDLLEGSGYLEKSRKLRPDKIGEPKSITIAGRDLVLNDGSIEELNTQLAQVFPGFKGKFYQDDPISIGESYISSISKQAGRDLAIARYAKSTNPHVGQIVGDLADALEQRNEVLARQNPLLDVIRLGHRPGAAAQAVAEAPEMPEQINDIPLNEFFSSTPSKVGTNDMLHDVMVGGKKYVKAGKADVKASTEKATGDLISIRDQLQKGLKGTADEAKAAIEQYDKVLRQHATTLKKLGPLTTNNLDEMVATLSQVSLRRGEIEQELATATTAVVSAEVAKQRPELEKLLVEARKTEAEAMRKLDEGPAIVRAEAKKRLSILQAPVEAAEMALNQAKTDAEARIPGVEQKQVDAALNTFRRSLTNSKDFDEQLKVYNDAVAGVTPAAAPGATVAAAEPPAQALPPLRPIEGEVLPPIQPAVEAGPLPKAKPPAKVRSKWETIIAPKTGNTIWKSDVDGSEIWQVRNSSRQITGYRAFDRNGRSIGQFATQKEARAAVDNAINETRAAAVTREPYRSPSFTLPPTKKPTKKQLAAEAAAKTRGEEYAARRAERLATEQAEREAKEAARRAAQIPRPPSRANPEMFDPRTSLELTGQVKMPPGLRSPYDEAVARHQALVAKLKMATDPAEQAKLQEQVAASERSFATGKWKEQAKARKILVDDIKRRKAIEADEAVIEARRQLEVQRRIADAKAESVIYVKQAGEEGRGVRVQDPNLGWAAGEERTRLPVEAPRQGRVIETPPVELPPPAASDRSGAAMPRTPQRWRKDSPAASFTRRENVRRAEHDAENARLVAKYQQDEDAEALIRDHAAAEAKHQAATEADLAQMKAEAAPTAPPKPAEPPLATRVASEVPGETGTRPKTADEHMADIASMDEEINKLYDTQAELGKLPETPETDEVMLANHKLIIQMEHNKAESMRRLQSVSQEAKKLPIENLAKYFPAKALESMTRDKMDKLINLQGRFDKLRSEIEAGARSLSRNDLKRKLGEAAGIRDEQNVIIGVGPRARQRAARNVASINEERKATSLQRLMHTNLPAGQEEKLSALERKMLALEKARPMDPKWFGGDRAIAQAYVDTFAPVMPSQYKGMAERRVAEQAKRARPAGQEFVGKAQRAVEQMSPSVPNLPSTEREAIGKLSQAELGFRESPAGRALAQQAGQARGQVKRSTHLLEGENLTERVRADLDVLNHPKLGPLTQTKEMVTNVEEALTNKSHLTKIRNDANAQAKSMLNPKAPGKSVEKGTIIQSIRDVARANPDMLDDNLSSTEALLDSAGKTYDRVVGLRSNVKEVEQMMDAATRKKGLPDVLLTTIGGNFSMIYDATGGKAAALKSGDYYVSNQLHEMMTNLFDISKEPGKFWRAVSTLTNIFKTYATLSPGFHVRNAMSAVFMNLSDGVRLGTQIEAAGLWQQYRKQGDPWLAKQTPEIKEAFSAAWNSGAGGRFTEAGFAQGGKSTVAEWLLSNKGTRLSQRVGERVEGSVRLAMGLDSVRKGESVDQAVARISRIHFDYADISKFDERAKQIVPFWTFLSRNLPLQMSQMWMRPKAYLTYEHFINNMASENDAFTPKYWLDAGAWNTGMTVPGEQTEGGPQGLPIYLQPDFGFTRIGADVADLQDALKGDFGAMLSNVNPLFTAPLEYASGRNFYTGQVYDEQSYSSQSGPLGTPIKWLAEALGQTNTSGQVSDKFANLLTSINPVQDRASRLFPALTGGDNPDKQRQLESIARYIGVPARTLTDKQRDSEFWRRFYETQDRQKALRVAQREVATGG